MNLRDYKRVYIIGNGGSYANAAHIANDLISVGIRAYTLDAATLTAIGNDYGYANIFSRWLGTVAEKGDLLIALSGSGKSPNIVNALKKAEEIGMKTLLITDFLKTRNMQQSEEDQLVWGHEQMRRLRDERAYEIAKDLGSMKVNVSLEELKARFPECKPEDLLACHKAVHE